MRGNVVRMHEFWWLEYIQGGKRDQYSFTYSAYRININILSLGVHDPRITKAFFDYSKHKVNCTGKKIFFTKRVNRLYIFFSGWKD